MLYTEHRDLDIAKGDKSHAIVEPVYLRQGESGGTQIIGTIYDGNLPLDITGYTAQFCMRNPNGQYVEPVPATVLNAAGGQVAVTTTHDMTEVEGTTETAYFQLSKNGEIVDTDNIELKILASYDLSTREAYAYKTKIEKMVEKLDDLQANYKDISNCTITYKAGGSGTTAPTGTYSATIPTVGQGEFLWARVQINYSNNTNQVFYLCARQGKDNTTWGVATETTDGLLSAADKKKLNGLNDITSGTNLIAGTREFRWGTVAGPLNWVYTDGFQGDKPTRTYIDKEGFTVANYSRTGYSGTTPLNMQTSCITGAKRGDIYTAFVAFMVDDVNAWDDKTIGALRCYDATNDTTVKSVELEKPAIIESGVWYIAKATIELTETLPLNNWVNFYLRLSKNGSINFKCPRILPGRINNSAWDYCPKDVASSYKLDEIIQPSKKPLWSGTLNSANPTVTVPGIRNYSMLWIGVNTGQTDGGSASIMIPFLRTNNSDGDYTIHATGGSLTGTTYRTVAARLSVSGEKVTYENCQMFEISVEGTIKVYQNRGVYRITGVV